MITNAAELLESFERELMNHGVWYWAGTDKLPGSKARVLTVMQKMLKAGVPDNEVKFMIEELMTTFYVEHEKQVKAKVGLRVDEFLAKTLKETGTLESPVIKELEHAAV